MKNRLWILIAVLAAITLVVEFTMVEHTGEHWWSHIPAFYILLGFFGSVIIIYITRWLGKFFILSDEDYYDR